MKIFKKKSAVEEAILNVPAKPWNYWAVWAVDNGGTIEELGLVRAGLTSGKDPVELWKATRCPQWVLESLIEIEQDSGCRGPVPAEAARRHKELFGRSSWWELNLGGNSKRSWEDYRE